MSTATKRARRSLRTIPMPMWVVVGAVGAIVGGVVLGDRTSFLQPVGSGYAMMLRIAVYPYLRRPVA